MSVCASIRLQLESKHNYTGTYTLKALELLLNFGWEFPTNFGGLYLPLGNVDDFNWQFSHALSESDLWAVIREKIKAEEFIGLELGWKDSEVSASFCFYENGEVSALLMGGRLVNSVYGRTEANWYLERIVTPFVESPFHIAKIEFSDTY